MLIGAEGEPFDSEEYIYELKLDGERCIAYLDKDKTILKNKRNILMLPKVPELSDIHKSINVRCILDGELAVIKDGKPDFFEIQKRSLMSNPVKIEMAAKKYSACFTAFDILYYEDRQVPTIHYYGTEYSVMYTGDTTRNDYGWYIVDERAAELIKKLSMEKSVDIEK